MNNLNQILIEGNLVRDPQFKHTPKGTAVCTFSVASNRYLKQDDDYEQEVSFFDITTWSQLAESCNEQLKKGRGVRIIGRLKQDRWQDPEGKTRARVHIIADHVVFKPVFKGKTSSPKKEASIQTGAF
ncbi:MAG: single-stranded DNA-binding protein [Spirochaetales bacterium]|nr:single-stranded DNA-binding protein [Spirochaetales bacterium]